MSLSQEAGHVERLFDDLGARGVVWQGRWNQTRRSAESAPCLDCFRTFRVRVTVTLASSVPVTSNRRPATPLRLDLTRVAKMYSTNSQFQPSASYLNQNHHQDANTNAHGYNPYYSPSNTATGMPRPSGPSHSISNSQIGFSVAGMSSSTSGHHHGGISSWSVGPGQGLGSSMNEGFGQSRSHYQPGYLMARYFSLLDARSAYVDFPSMFAVHVTK